MNDTTTPAMARRSFSLDDPAEPGLTDIQRRTRALRLAFADNPGSRELEVLVDTAAVLIRREDRRLAA
jgi:hypothetical protein